MWRTTGSVVQSGPPALDAAQSLSILLLLGVQLLRSDIIASYAILVSKPSDILVNHMSNDAVHAPEPSAQVTWEIEPERFLSRNYELYQDDQLVATLRMELFRERCEFAIAAHEFNVRRTSLWKDTFQLRVGADSICDVKRTFWSRRFELSAADQSWVLQPAGWLTRTYQVFAGERVVGTISPAGWWTRRRRARFATEVPPPIQVLAIFLVLVVSQRQNRSPGQP